MPRPKAQKRDQQIYKLAAYGAVVTIDYLIDNPPPFFQPQAGVVIVGEHACQSAPLVPTARSRSTTNGPEQDTPEMIEWKARRAKPLTPADTARESGFPPLDFETTQNIAASMGGSEEPIV